MWFHEHHVNFLGHFKVCHNFWELYEVFLDSVLNRVSWFIDKYDSHKSIILVYQISIGPITFELVREPHGAKLFLLNNEI